MRWSESRSAVAFRCETWWTKYASGVLAICAREGQAAKWQCNIRVNGRQARMGLGSRVAGSGQPGVYPGFTACVEPSRLAVVWFPSGGGGHLCQQGGGVVLRVGAGDRGRSGSTIRAVWNAPRVDRCERVCPVNGVPGLRVIPEPIMCVVDSVFKAGPWLHQGGIKLQRVGRSSKSRNGHLKGGP